MGYIVAALALTGVVIALTSWRCPCEVHDPGGVTARLSIRSVPLAAEVWLDGARLGITPLSKPVSTGSHKRHLELRHEGFEPRVMDLVIDRDIRLGLKLEPTKERAP